MNQLNETLINPGIIKVRFYEGSVIVVNVNGVLDYFGRTANIDLVRQQSMGNDIVVKKILFDKMHISTDESNMTEFTTQLHGMDELVELIRSILQ